MTGKPRYDRFRISLCAHAEAGRLRRWHSVAFAGRSACRYLRRSARRVARRQHNRTRRTSAQAQRYAEAATRQVEEIEKTRAMQERRGCFANSYRGVPVALPHDPGYERPISTRSNASAIDCQAAAMPPGSAPSAARLESNGCNAPQRIARTEPGSVTVIPESPRSLTPQIAHHRARGYRPPAAL